MHKFIYKTALAESLGISVRTLENWVATRGFPPPRTVAGSRLAFFNIAEIEAWMEKALEREGLL